MRVCVSIVVVVATSLSLVVSPSANADAVTEWNRIAGNFVVDSGLATPPANRVMGIVHTAIYRAANAVSRRYPSAWTDDAASDASLDAAIASASYVSLSGLLPGQTDAIERAYQVFMERVPDGPEKASGVSVGKKAAQAVLRLRTNDGADIEEAYRPHTTAGQYVPTTIPAVPAWAKRKPWLMTSSAQFRPGAPPDLTSRLWARDFEEVKALGALAGSARSEEQTAMARFWEATLPPIYHGVVNSVATQPGRSPTQNARLFALVTQATDDALIAVFEAKYHYGFWRPITAIRNADLDDNDVTQRDAKWKPYIPTPMHPEYPCAHCVVAATVGAILQAEVGDHALPLLTTSSTTADGAVRSWTTIESFVQEVSNARIYDGVHYRTSSEAGSSMGKAIGEFATKVFE